MSEKLRKIIENFGDRNQLKKLSEEVYEFQEAVLDYINDEYTSYVGINNHHIEHITEELADILVLLNQFKAIYNLDSDEIRKKVNEKIERTLQRIDDGY